MTSRAVRELAEAIDRLAQAVERLDQVMTRLERLQGAPVPYTPYWPPSPPITIWPPNTTGNPSPYTITTGTYTVPPDSDTTYIWYPDNP
jgi:hypothetical protein